MGDFDSTSCPDYCELLAVCRVFDLGEDDRRKIQEKSELRLLEASMSVKDEPDEELQRDMMEIVARMEIRFADDPEGLKRALSLYGESYGVILDMQEAQRGRYEDAVARAEQSEHFLARRRETVEAFRVALKRDGCNGLVRSRFGFKRTQCSSTADSSVKSTLKSMSRADDTLTRNILRGTPAGPNLARYYNGEYGS